MTVTETVEYTARDNRKYAQRKLMQSYNSMIGRPGLTDAEKIEHLEAARNAAQKAVDAIEQAMSQVFAETAQKAAQSHEAKNGEPDVENYDADEMEAYAASI